MKNTINNREKVGQAALAQAMYNVFSLSQRDIAGLLNVSPRTVWNHLHAIGGLLAWEERTRKSEAVKEAEVRIKEHTDRITKNW